MTAMEAVEKALASWGVSRDPVTKKLITSDGRALGVRWTEVKEVAPTMEVLRGEELEIELAATILDSALRALVVREN